MCGWASSLETDVSQGHMTGIRLELGCPLWTVPQQTSLRIFAPKYSIQGWQSNPAWACGDSCKGHPPLKTFPHNKERVHLCREGFRQAAGVWSLTPLGAPVGSAPSAANNTFYSYPRGCFLWPLLVAGDLKGLVNVPLPLVF